jgi:hypothetical protein
VQFVRQLVGHLGGEARPFASGRDVQSMPLTDERDLAPTFITNSDLVRSIAMDVRTHGPPPCWACPPKALGPPIRFEHFPDPSNIQRPLGRRRAEFGEDQLTNRPTEESACRRSDATRGGPEVLSNLIAHGNRAISQVLPAAAATDTAWVVTVFTTSRSFEGSSKPSICETPKLGLLVAAPNTPSDPNMSGCWRRPARGVGHELEDARQRVRRTKSPASDCLPESATRIRCRTAAGACPHHRCNGSSPERPDQHNRCPRPRPRAPLPTPLMIGPGAAERRELRPSRRPTKG